MSSSTSSTVYYEWNKTPLAQNMMICNHAYDCGIGISDCEWHRPKEAGYNISGHCSKRNIFVEIIPYRGLGKQDPNTVFKMRNKK